MKKNLLLIIMCILGLFTVRAQETSFFYDFEDGTLAGLRAFAGEGSDAPLLWTVTNDSYYSNGTNVIYSESCDYDWNAYPSINNYIVTENAYAITAESKLSWYVRNTDYNVAYADVYEVVVSEDGETFTQIWSGTAEMGVYEKELSLAEYAGKNLYIGFRHYCTDEYGGAAIVLDNIVLTAGEGGGEEPTPEPEPEGVCTLVLTMTDTYGDGWNYNTLTVSYGTASQTLTLSSGKTVTHIVPIPQNAVVTLTYTVVGSSSYPVENGLVVAYESGKEILNVAQGSLSATTSWEFVVDCTPAVPETPVLAAEVTSDTTIVLTWAAVEGATSYNVYSAETLVANVTETTYTVEGLTAETEYTFVVKAVNEVGESEASNVATAKTLAAAPVEPEPVAPTNVVATADGQNSIIVTWNAVDGAAEYNIYHNEELISETNTTSDTIEGLTESTEYCFAVTALFYIDVEDETYVFESELSETVCAITEEEIEVPEDPDLELPEYDFIVTIGSGDTMSSSLTPYYGNYEYSVSQQIYTAEEIGVDGGIIKSIAFKSASENTATRNISVFMKNTTKDHFESSSDWIGVSENDLVYEGPITTTGIHKWCGIELTEEFVYGGDNILLFVVDNTGQWSNEYDSFYIYFSSENTSLHHFRDGNSYDPYDLSLSAPGLLDKKNYIQFTFAGINGPMPTEFFYDFEDLSLEDWTTIDADGDGHQWLLDSTNSTLVSYSYSYNGVSLYPDNYIFTTSKYKITEMSNLSFSHTCVDYAFNKDKFAVVISEDGINFNIVWEYLYTEDYDSDWGNITIDLSSYAGEALHIGFRHFDCNGEFGTGVRIDNIKLATEDIIIEPEPTAKAYRLESVGTAWDNTAYTYDEVNKNRVVSIESGLITELEYNAEGQLVGAIASYEDVDEDGNPIEVIVSGVEYEYDENGVWTSYTETSHSWFGGTVTSETVLSYDAEGRLVSLTSEESKTEFAYNAEGLVSEKVVYYAAAEEEGEGTRGWYVDSKETYTYENGNLVKLEYCLVDWKTGDFYLAEKAVYKYDVKGNCVVREVYSVEGETETLYSAGKYYYNETIKAEDVYSFEYPHFAAMNPAKPAFVNIIAKELSYYSYYDEELGEVVEHSHEVKLYNYNPEVLSLPLQPMNLTAEVMSATEVELAWAGFPDAESFTLYQGEAVLAEGLVDPYYTVENLEMGVEYCFAVMATNSVGNSEVSETVCVTIELPAAPVVAVDTVTETTVTLTWAAVEGATSYNVYSDTVVIATVTETTYTIEGLTAGIEYCFAVTALFYIDVEDETYAFESELSETVCVTTEEEIEVPEDPDLELPEYDFIVTIGSGDTMSSSLTPYYGYYEYSVSQQIYTAEEIGVDGGIIKSIAFKSASENTATRNISVFMKNTTKDYFESDTDWIDVSESDLVYEGPITTTGIDKWCGIELNEEFIYRGDNIALLVIDNTGSWDSAYDSFYVYFAAENTSMYHYRDGNYYDPYDLSIQAADVTDQKNYIQFTFAGNNGPMPIVPETPQYLNAEAVSSSEIWVSWDAVEYATDYEVLRSTYVYDIVVVDTIEYNNVYEYIYDTIAYYETIAYYTTDTYLEDTGLEANTEYCYQVAAINGNADLMSDYSYIVCAVTLQEPIVPAAPNTLVASVDGDLINLYWTPVENATEYGVYHVLDEEYHYLGSIYDTVVQLQVTVLNTEYCFVVTAFNEVGESEYSNEVCVYVPAPALTFSYNGNKTTDTINDIKIIRDLNASLEIQFDLEISNNTANDMNVVCEVEDLSNIGQSYICWGSCYMPGITEVVNTVYAGGNAIFNGHAMFVDEEWNELPKGTVIPVRYTFYDESNPSEKYVFNVNFIYNTTRNVLIEEFTGRNCGWCPDGHRMANEIATANPGKVFPINIHAGGYSTTNYPNLNTTDGKAIMNGFNVAALPSGNVNRNSNSAIGRQEWESRTNSELAQTAEVNISGNVAINPVTRQAEITVELDYLSNSNYSKNYLTIMMLQDSIFGSQSGADQFNPEQIVDGQYCHMHVLRDVITNTWGDAITPTTAGTHITKTYIYEIPEVIGDPNGVEVDLDNIYFLAFVTEKQDGTPTHPVLNVNKLEKVNKTPDTAILAAPTNLRAYIRQDVPDYNYKYEITTAWDAVDGAQGYDIFVNTETAQDFYMGYTNGTEFVMGTNQETTFEFYVVAFNDETESEPSEVYTVNVVNDGSDPSSSLIFFYEGNEITNTVNEITLERDINESSEIQFDLVVGNSTANDMNVVCEIEDLSNVGYSYVCWGSCYMPGITEVVNTVYAGGDAIFNGHAMFVDEEWNELPKGTVIPVRYKFYDEKNPSEKYVFNVKFIYENNDTANYWTPDESFYANNMTIITTIEIDGEEQYNTNLELGAFCNGELRGSARLQYVDAPANRYECFLMVYGNSGDDITFRLYDHGTGLESDFRSSEVVDFEVNATVGDIVNPYIVNFKGSVLHSRDLTSGWNWYSTYIVNKGAEGLTNLEAAVGTNGIQIKNQTKFVNQASGNWYGTLTSTAVEDMFMIQMSAAHTLNLEGYVVNPADHPITLGTNWKWISYPLAAEMNVEDAFASANPSNGDYVKSQKGFAQYYEGLGWSGTLKTMTPGMGYMYQNTSGYAKTLVYPMANAKSKAEAQVEEELHWTADATKYPMNMTVIAVVEDAARDYEVAAFSNGECRGSARPVYIEALGQSMIFMTIYGDDNDNVSFRYYDVTTGDEVMLNDEMTFEVNATHGDVMAPYVMTLSTMGIDEASSGFNIYPNPVNDKLYIETEAEIEEIVVYDVYGRIQNLRISETQKLRNSIDVTDLNSGVYFIQIKTEEGNIVKRIIKN